MQPLTDYRQMLASVLAGAQPESPPAAGAPDYNQIIAQLLQDPNALQAAYEPFDEEARTLRDQQGLVQSLLNAQSTGSQGPGATGTSGALGGLGKSIRQIGGALMYRQNAQALQNLAARKKEAGPAISAMEILKERARIGGNGGMNIVSDADGNLYYANPRDPTAPAQPLLGPDGKQIRKPKAVDPLQPLKETDLRLGIAKRQQDLAKEAKAGADGKELPPSQVNELADYETAEKQVDDIFAKAEKENISGFGAKLNQAATQAFGLQGTDAARFEGASAPARQGVGTILEGGKLAAGDEAKYKNMLPRYGDSPEVLAEKKAALKAYLQTRKAERIKALGSAGYKVPQSSAAPNSTPATGTVTVRRKSDGKTKLVTPDVAAKLAQDPNFEVLK